MTYTYVIDTWTSHVHKAIDQHFFHKCFPRFYASAGFAPCSRPFRFCHGMQLLTGTRHLNYVTVQLRLSILANLVGTVLNIMRIGSSNAQKNIISSFNDVTLHGNSQLNTSRISRGRLRPGRNICPQGRCQRQYYLRMYHRNLLLILTLSFVEGEEPPHFARTATKEKGPSNQARPVLLRQRLFLSYA
jgi:hypothetical protein